MSKLFIKIEKTDANAKIPVKGSIGAAGFDLFSVEAYDLKPLERKLFKTGIKLNIPPEFYGRIAPRSGLAWKNGIMVGGGVIDSDFSGEIGVILFNSGSESKKFEIGDRIAQIIFEYCPPAKFIEVIEVDKTVRNEGGFGSTGLR